MSLENADYPEEHGPIHDEVYLALIPITGRMSLHGMFPSIGNRKQVNAHSMIEQKFQLGPKWLILNMVSVFGIVTCCFCVNYHYAIRISDTLESLVLVFVVINLNMAAMANLFTMMMQGPKWAAYFKQWQTLDRLLGIARDQKLRSFVRAVSKAFSFYVASALGTVLFATFLKYYAPSEDDYTGDLFPLGMLCYSIFINSCQLMPEILFACFSVAIKVRIAVLTKKVRQIFDNQSPIRIAPQRPDKLETSDALQEARIAYQTLIDVIRSTNSFMGPILCVCVLVTSAYLSTTVLMVFFQSLENMGFISLKIVFSSCCILRLMSICVFADQIKCEIKKFKRVIYVIPALQLQLSRDSVDEMTLFMKSIKKSNAVFTASDFFNIDKELLNKVSGAILTYTLTLFEFSQQT